jgi:hypothetical protein
VTNKKGEWDNGTVPRWPIPCLSATVMSCEWGGTLTGSRPLEIKFERLRDTFV